MASSSLPDPTRLAAAAANAAEIRALALDPDVIALRVERIRAQVDTCAWVAIGLGLAFTAVNVQTFAAAGAPAWSPGWLVAWLLDPMVSLLLIGVLRAEQVTARWQVPTGVRVTAAKWGCFAATYAMNTWASWTAGVPSGVVLHSVPPLVVLLGAEVAPELRDRLTAAVRAAATSATTSAAASPTAATPSPRDAETDLPGEALPPAEDPGQDRTAALAAPPVAGPRPGHHLVPETSPDPSPDPGPEPGPVLDVITASAHDDDQNDSAATGAGGAGGAEVNPRVVVLAELLAAGAAVTGAQAAALHEVSERQGRRLLREARELAMPSRGAAPGPSRGVLRVVPNEPGGGDAVPHETTDETTDEATAAIPGGQR